MSDVRTYLVDANRLSRDGLARIFSESRFQIIGEADGLSGLLDQSGEDGGVDLIILDSNILEDRVGESIGALRQALPNAKTVILGNSQQPEVLLECFSAGADGCLLKDISSAALLESLDLVLLSERVFPSQLLTLVMRGNASFGVRQPVAAVSEARLSERELQILRYLVSGHSNKVIANRLDVTEATVKVHLKSILRKIKAQNRTQAAIWALNHGLAGTPASDMQF
ncbi:LuxR C-terminal-related transcriptional regulator [Ferruginivarius sediminum]|nr:response regulator transcription factor [Ferruginivarius sediminum]